MRHCRESVDAITNCILKNGRNKIAYEKLTAELAARDGEILRLCERNKIRNPNRYLYAEIFQRDLYRRMGNIVIREILKKAPRRTAESARNPSCQSAAESISGKSDGLYYDFYGNCRKSGCGSGGMLSGVSGKNRTCRNRTAAGTNRNVVFLETG